MRMVMAVAAAALVLGGTAAAQTSMAPTADGAVPAPAKKKERKICRPSADTGSHMTSSICHTVAEWQAIDSTQAGAGGERYLPSRTAN